MIQGGPLPLGVAVTARRPVSSRTFWMVAGALFLLAFTIRLAQAIRVPDSAIVGDALWYHQAANLLAEGRGFINPFNWHSQNRVVPTAFHAPLWPLVLSISSWFGWTSVTAHEVVASAVGAAAVVAVALLGREIAGPRVGIIAAAIAAVYPQRWLVDSILYSEGLAAGLTAATLLLVYRFRRRPSVARAVGLGAALGLTALARFEVLLFAVLIIVPLTMRLAAVPRARRVRLLAVTAATAIAVLSPWVIRNATTFSRPVLGSTNGDAVVFYANCQSTYYDPEFLGTWDPGCGSAHRAFPAVRCDWMDTRDRPACGDESERAASLRDRGAQYARSHLGRLASVVVWTRIGRAWDFYGPFENTQASVLPLVRYPILTLVGVYVYWLVLIAATGGAVVLHRRRGPPVWPLLMPALAVTATAVYAYGTMRFRSIVEPSLFVLAAIALDVGILQLARRWREGATRRSVMARARRYSPLE